MKMENTYSYLLAALIIACGMTISGYFLSLTAYRSTMAGDTVAVKGLAEKEVKADWAQVPIHFSRSILLSKKEYDERGHTQIVAELYRHMDADHKLILEKLASEEFTLNEISQLELWSDSEDYRGEDGAHTDTKVTVNGKLMVESEKVFNISSVVGSMASLMSQGVTVSTGYEKYHFSKLNDIKPAMLREAIAAARVAATEFSDNTGVELGRIKSASQGRFSIVDKGESYSDTDRIEKTVRVVTNIKFYLTD